MIRAGSEGRDYQEASYRASTLSHLLRLHRGTGAIVQRQKSTRGAALCPPHFRRDQLPKNTKAFALRSVRDDKKLRESLCSRAGPLPGKNQS